MLSQQVALKDITLSQEEKLPTEAKVLPQNDSYVSAINTDLRKNIESIQQAFEAAWNRYPQEQSQAMSYYRSSDQGILGELGLNIESLFEKLKSYKDAPEIQGDFRYIRRSWESDCKNNKLNKAFCEGYLLSLRMMEAFFIEDYMRRVSLEIKPVTIKELKPTEDVEIKASLEVIAKRVVSNYKDDLSRQLFAKKSEAFMGTLVPEIKKCSGQINLFHKHLKAVVEEAKPVMLESKGSDHVDKINQLVLEETRYSQLTGELVALKAEQDELIKVRDALLKKNINAVEEYIKSTRSETISPTINYDDIHEFDPKIDALRKLESSISWVQSQNNLRSLLAQAKKSLNGLMQKNDEYADGLRKGLLDFKDRSGIFSFDNDAINKTYDKLYVLFNDFAKLPRVIETQSDLTPTLIDITELTEKQMSMKAELETLNSQLRELVSREVSRTGLIKMQEETISKERDEVMRLATYSKEMRSIPINCLSSRRLQLDKEWEALSPTEESAKQLRTIIERISLKANTSRGVEQSILRQTAAMLTKKLDVYQRSIVTAVQPDKLITESKGEKRAGILVQAGSQQSPVSHWYSKFIDKPWKRAICTGLFTFAVVAIALTVAGLAIELAMALGGAGFLLFGGGVMLKSHLNKQSESVPLDADMPTPNESSEMVSVNTKRATTARLPFAPAMASSLAHEDTSKDKNQSCFGALFSCGKKPKEITQQEMELVSPRI